MFVCVLNAREVKVLLAQGAPNAALKASGPFKIVNLDNNKKYKAKKGGVFEVSPSKIGSIKNISKAEVSLSDKDGFFTFNGNKYRGPLLIYRGKRGIDIIERADLEEYLKGVLPYEMSPSWPLEALKAQAVSARTYALKSLEQKKSGPFDLYSDTGSQVYKGSVNNFANIAKAVEETKNQVLRYEGEIFYTFYHSNCGGGTDALPWLKNEIKPLRGVSCKYDKEGANANWSLSLSQSAVNDFLAPKQVKGKLKKIKIGKKLESGRASTLIFITNKEKRAIACDEFRLYIGANKFKSCKISKIKGLYFEGKGFGHGMGLCQEGAKEMARRGKNYKKILKYYYPSSKLGKI